MGSIYARATAFVAGCGGLLLAPSLAFADVGPKCGCTMNSAGAGVSWLVLGGLTALIILRRRRDDQ
jgi:MYXO-CTERM domain-containing protein